LKKEDKMTRKVIVTVREVLSFWWGGLEVGDRFVVKDANISMKESSRICASGFSTMYPKTYSHRRGLDLALIGSSHTQCPDPGGWSPYHKEGGTVIFEIRVDQK
jgi:uncharacterized repeat protein (TIGR04076 family)